MKLPLAAVVVCLAGCSGATYLDVIVQQPASSDGGFGANVPAPDAAIAETDSPAPPMFDTGAPAVDAAPSSIDAGARDDASRDAALDASDAALACIPVNPNWMALYCPGDVGWSCPPDDAGVQPLPPVSGCVHTPAALFVWCCAASDAGDGGGQ